MTDELTDLLDQVCDTHGAQKASVQAAELRALLVDAMQAQRDWAGPILDAALIDGLAKRVKAHQRKRNRVAMKMRAGNVVDIATIVGTRRDGAWVQTSIADMDWPEVDTWATTTRRNIEGLEPRVIVAEKLQRLRDAYPDSSGPADAARRAGTTVEDFIAAEVAS